jgi:signal transduction histidine kinase
MSTNQDLQATHKILQFIETSKQQGENILDQIPGVFAVVDVNGDILRSNALLAEYMNLDEEDLLYESFSKVFKKEEWSIFNNHLKKIIKGDEKNVDFELSLTTENLETKAHMWYLGKLEGSEKNLFTVVGKDISELKAAQQNLIEIFSSVPLAIVTIDVEGKFVGESSKFSEILLGQASLAGKRIQEIVFDKVIGLTKVEEESLDGLLSSVGHNELIFSVIKDELPSRLEIESELGKTTWLGVTYQPIVYEGNVHKVMLILQDVNDLVKAEALSKEKEMLDEAHVGRILQLKRMEVETQEIIFEEFIELFEKLDSALIKSEGKAICGYLHGIKGCARVSGLKVLTEFTHEAESNILEKGSSGEKIKKTWIAEQIQPVQEEWDEVFTMYKALNKQDNTPKATGKNSEVSDELKNLMKEYHQRVSSTADGQSKYIGRELLLMMESYGMHPLSELEAVLSDNVKKTAEALEKEVEIVFDWGNSYLDRSTLSTLRESLTHILNNAVDHGIELPRERINLGKPEKGRIIVSAIDVMGELVVTCVDDGHGLDVAKVRDIAIKKKLKSSNDIIKSSDSQIIDLIFSEGLSSAEQVTDISGRGIGLSSVREHLEELKGSVVVKNTLHSGTEFQITLPSERSVMAEFVEYESAFFIDRLEFELDRINLRNKSSYKLSYTKELKDRILEGGCVHINIENLLFALLHTIIDLGDEKSIEILFCLAPNGMMEVKFSSDVEKEHLAKGYLYNTCLLYLRQHKGGMQISNDGTVSVQFGYLKSEG